MHIMNSRGPSIKAADFTAMNVQVVLAHCCEVGYLQNLNALLT